MRCRCRDAGGAAAARPSPLPAPLVVALAIAALLAALAAPPARAAASGGDFGFTWATVGDPGNAPVTVPNPIPGLPDTVVGAVAHEYRIMTREVTNRQWFGFVNAYAPFVGINSESAQAFLGTGILFAGRRPDGVPLYRLLEGFEEQPVRVGWRFTARFANWLHNGQAITADAFERGAYDNSTFGVTQINGINVITDQARRSDGARFWIPSFDERTKAAHYDPDRYGPGQPGYWLYPDGGDEPLTVGRPELGGETNGGRTFPPGQARPLDVGSYPHVRSPYGLLDASGGAAEWIEDVDRIDQPQRRRINASGVFSPWNLDPATSDRLGHFEAGGVDNLVGVRLSSVVPTPPCAMVALGGVFLWSRRNRPCERH